MYLKQEEFLRRLKTRWTVPFHVELAGQYGVLARELQIPMVTDEIMGLAEQVCEWLTQRLRQSHSMQLIPGGFACPHNAWQGAAPTIPAIIVCPWELATIDTRGMTYQGMQEFVWLLRQSAVYGTLVREAATVCPASLELGIATPNVAFFAGYEVAAENALHQRWSATIDFSHVEAGAWGNFACLYQPKRPFIIRGDPDRDGISDTRCAAIVATIPCVGAPLTKDWIRTNDYNRLREDFLRPSAASPELVGTARRAQRVGLEVFNPWQAITD